MVSTLIVPQKMLEEIRKEGREASRRDMEATGVLIGQYNRKHDSIRVLEKISLYKKIGDDSFYGNLYDKFKGYLWTHRILWASLRAAIYERELNRIGKKLGFVGYHSHGHGTWSSNDLESVHLLEDLTNDLDVSTALMLYNVDRDKFEVIDENKNPVKLEVI